MKEKKLIIGFTALIIIALCILGIVNGTKKDKEETKPGNTAKATSEDGTNFWDNVEVFEGEETVVEAVTNEDGDIETDANGEFVTVVYKKSDINKETEKSTEKSKSDKKDKKKDKNKSKDNSKDDKETPDLDGGDIQVIEESYVQPTDKNGETISEEYPGQADGWSPIVSPDDLGN
ncbi:MAG: hypothetical protein E7254_10325 [Lachnospiraceae bacterium]|nr:hypothetical protein [Lachnospiraceae bacterium]